MKNIAYCIDCFVKHSPSFHTGTNLGGKMKPKFNLKIVQWENGGPLQLNVICTNCNGSGYITDLYMMYGWFQHHECPLVISFAETLEGGEINIEKLEQFLEAKRK